MPAYPRREIVAGDEIGLYHCVARCVRRAFLCGRDDQSGRDFEHRKEWIRRRLEQLASIFAIDVCSYAVMSNHFHLVLRIRPDLARDWSAEEVALRWKTLCPPRDPISGCPFEPAECDIHMIVSDPDRLAVIRERLSSLSWFMRSLCEPIARRANREDGCTGRFWEGRFRSQALLDEAAILACGIYVDLNPIRACVADTPEDSQYTSAYDRIDSIFAETLSISEASGSSTLESATAGALVDSTSTGDERRSDSWLSELTLREGAQEHMDAGVTDVVAGLSVDGAKPAVSGEIFASRRSLPARASDDGFLPIEVDAYLALLDWTGRQLRATKRGAIPDQLAPILERLGLISEGWIDTIREFGRRFKTAAGRCESLSALAARRGKCWLHGQRAATLAFR